jgi:hypothetical protein
MLDSKDKGGYHEVYEFCKFLKSRLLEVNEKTIDDIYEQYMGEAIDNSSEEGETTAKECGELLAKALDTFNFSTS